MPYDTNVTSSTLYLEQKNRVFRVEFERPDVAGAGSLTAHAYLLENTLDATPESPTSGSVLISTTWLIDLTRDQIFDIPNAASFFSGLVSLIGSLKQEFKDSGSLATGSIQRVA